MSLIYNNKDFSKFNKIEYELFIKNIINNNLNVILNCDNIDMVILEKTIKNLINKKSSFNIVINSKNCTYIINNREFMMVKNYGFVKNIKDKVKGIRTGFNNENILDDKDYVILLNDFSNINHKKLIITSHINIEKFLLFILNNNISNKVFRFKQCNLSNQQIKEIINLSNKLNNSLQLIYCIMDHNYINQELDKFIYNFSLLNTSIIILDLNYNRLINNQKDIINMD